MKKIFKLVFAFSVLTLSISVNIEGQNLDSNKFFEFGFRTSKFFKTSFLSNSRFKDQIKDPTTEVEGLIPSNEGRNYSLKLRYGTQIKPRTQLISEFGFAIRDEQAVCFCHVCDKIAKSNSLTKLFSFDTGLGIRYFIGRFKRFNFSVEAFNNISFTANESNLFYYGYSINPIIDLAVNDKIKLLLKYGFEQSFSSYEKKERYFEIAFSSHI